MDDPIRFRFFWVMDDKSIQKDEISLVELMKGNGTWLMEKDVIARCRFTGLLDAKGKEIYEEDVIESTSEPKVRFKIRFGWNGDKDSYGWCFSEFAADKSHKDMKIIGNIYSNPELVK